MENKYTKREKEIKNNYDKALYETLLEACENACEGITLEKKHADALKAMCFRLKCKDALSLTSLIYMIKTQVEHPNWEFDGEPFTAEKITIEEFIAKREAYEQEKEKDN